MRGVGFGMMKIWVRLGCDWLVFFFFGEWVKRKRGCVMEGGGEMR